MGYTTDFEGAFTLTPAATREQVAYINAFSRTRRMKRNAELTTQRPDPIREAVGLPVGEDGCYFVGADLANHGQEFNAPDVIDSNEPPGAPTFEQFRGSDFLKSYSAFDKALKDAIKNGSQPGLWCQWELTDSGEQLEWDGSEKFYNYVEWLRYLINNFFAPWGITLNGEIEWFGEDRNDRGKIVVTNNVVETLKASVSYA